MTLSVWGGRAQCHIYFSPPFDYEALPCWHDECEENDYTIIKKLYINDDTVVRSSQSREDYTL